jgi:hypothetical protein
MKVIVMAPEDPTHDLRQLWQRQERQEVPLSLEDVRGRAHRMTRKVRLRNLREYVAGIVALGFIVVGLVTYPHSNAIVRSGAVLLGAGILYVLYHLHAWGSARALPADLGLKDALDFQCSEMVRQRDLLQGVWRWYMLPFFPGMALILIGRAIESPDRRLLAAIVAAAAVLMAAYLARLNQRAARRIQQSIDQLRETVVTRTIDEGGILDRSFGDQIAIWLLTSILFATLGTFVITRFVPTLLSYISLSDALPTGTRNIVIWLILVVMAVCTQAAWWLIRRDDQVT